MENVRVSFKRSAVARLLWPNAKEMTGNKKSMRFPPSTAGADKL